MKVGKKIRFRGHLWDEILREDNDHMREAGYAVILRRTPSASEMKKNGGCAVGGVDAKIEQLPKQWQALAAQVGGVIS